MKIPQKIHIIHNLAGLAALLLLGSVLQAGTGAFNCGGGDLQVGSILYQADRAYAAANGSGAVGGTAHVINLLDTGLVIEGTANPQLYVDAREALSEYRFDVPNGLYLLTLHFVELTQNGPNLRKFSVSAEGHTLLQDFDIYAVIEKNYALEYQFAVQVNDGQLNVKFVPSIGNTTISGIAVQSLTQDTAPPPVPAPVTALGSYYRNIIDWPDVTALDLAGYLVFGSNNAAGPYTLLNQTPTPVSRYFDDAVTPGAARYYAVKSVDVFGNQSAASTVVTATPKDKTQSTLPVYELSVTADNLAILQADPFTDDYVDADFTNNTVAYPGIGVRFRGTSSRTADKKSWKLNFKKSKPFEGKDKLNQKASPIDASLIRECLGDFQFQTTAAMTPNCAFSHLEVNGEYRGVFSKVENMDSDFLNAHGLNPDGKMFEANDPRLSNFQILGDYSVAWDDDSATEEGYDTLAQFIETINNTPDADFDVTIASVLNVDSYLDFYAGLMLIADIDHTAHNYEVYLNPDSLIWEVMPIDFDLAFLAPALPINYGTLAVPDKNGTHNILTERILAVPRFKQWWVRKMAELLGSDFTPGVLNPRIDDFHNQISDDATRDVFKRYREVNNPFLNSNTSLKNFVPLRRASVNSQLPSFSPGISQPIMINEVMALNQTGITDEAGERDPWVELYNPTSQPFDLTGRYLSNNPLNRTMWQFPNGASVPAGGHLLVWLDASPAQGPLHANFTISGKGQAVALFGAIAAGNPLLDVIAFGPQKPDVSYGRRFSGSALWCPQGAASPGGPNTGR